MSACGQRKKYMKVEEILIRVGDKNMIRVCDVKCYAAEEPTCDCVCQGRNHGVGYTEAVRLTIEKNDFYKKMYGTKLTYSQEIMNKIMRFN
jgi:hypothetical protein